MMPKYDDETRKLMDKYLGKEKTKNILTKDFEVIKKKLETQETPPRPPKGSKPKAVPKEVSIKKSPLKDIIDEMKGFKKSLDKLKELSSTEKATDSLKKPTPKTKKERFKGGGGGSGIGTLKIIKPPYKKMKGGGEVVAKKPKKKGRRGMGAATRGGGAVR